MPPHTRDAGRSLSARAPIKLLRVFRKPTKDAACVRVSGWALVRAPGRNSRKQSPPEHRIARSAAAFDCSNFRAAVPPLRSGTGPALVRVESVIQVAQWISATAQPWTTPTASATGNDGGPNPAPVQRSAPEIRSLIPLLRSPAKLERWSPLPENTAFIRISSPCIRLRD
jgi:hypothetical protein